MKKNVLVIEDDAIALAMLQSYFKEYYPESEFFRPETESDFLEMMELGIDLALVDIDLKGWTRHGNKIASDYISKNGKGKTKFLFLSAYDSLRAFLFIAEALSINADGYIDKRSISSVVGFKKVMGEVMDDFSSFYVNEELKEKLLLHSLRMIHQEALKLVKNKEIELTEEELQFLNLHKNGTPRNTVCLELSLEPESRHDKIREKLWGKFGLDGGGTKNIPPNDKTLVAFAASRGIISF